MTYALRAGQRDRTQAGGIDLFTTSLPQPPVDFAYVPYPHGASRRNALVAHLYVYNGGHTPDFPLSLYLCSTAVQSMG